MIEIALAIALVLTLIAVLLGCYAAEGLSLISSDANLPSMNGAVSICLMTALPLKKRKERPPSRQQSHQVDKQAIVTRSEVEETFRQAPNSRRT